MHRSVVSQLTSFVLPFTVLLIIPFLILWPGGFRIGWSMGLPWDAVVAAVGALVTAIGICGLMICIRLFINVGKGTLAPWSPTQKLVAIGPYRYMRNPMISSVAITLIGETIFFGSLGILIEFVLFVVINHVYFIFSEEPGLEKRFGEDYRVYKNNVPRWLPRLKPWESPGK